MRYKKILKVLKWVTWPVWFPIVVAVAIVIVLALDIGCMLGIINMG